MSTNPNQGRSPQDLHRRDELLTITEVADIVRVPIATLRYRRHLGTGRTASGRRALPANEVITWRKSQSDGTHPHESSASQRLRRTSTRAVLRTQTQPRDRPLTEGHDCVTIPGNLTAYPRLSPLGNYRTKSAMPHDNQEGNPRCPPGGPNRAYSK